MTWFALACLWSALFITFVVWMLYEIRHAPLVGPEDEL